jgi:integrase
VDRISNFEQWKIIYLGLVAGLRYNEIDKLRLRDICRKTGKISIRAHEEFQPKAGASEGDVMVSEGAAKVVKEMLNHTQGEWLLLEARSSRTKGYRSGLNHDKAVAWLRRYQENGFHPFADVPKPLHELRKEAGTLVNQKHGLNEAKNFLRHGDIATTATYYVGSKGQITTGLC